MSMEVLEGRVHDLEREQARQGAVQARLVDEVKDVSSGVKQLLERQAGAPSTLTGKTIAATCGGLVGVAYVVWWLIGASPAVVDLRSRVDELDNPRVGRVPAMERRLEKLDAWTPRVTRN